MAKPSETYPVKVLDTTYLVVRRPGDRVQVYEEPADSLQASYETVLAGLERELENMAAAIKTLRSIMGV